MNKLDPLIRFFMSLTTDMDVCPDGFATAKSPDNGNGGSVSFGMVDPELEMERMKSEDGRIRIVFKIGRIMKSRKQVL